MAIIETALSPVHHLLEPLGPHWDRAGGAPIVWRYAEVEVEQKAMRHLGLCDVSVLPKLGVKGPASAQWLCAQGVELPAENFETRQLADGGKIVNLTGGEFLLESSITASSVPMLSAQLGPDQAGVYRAERNDATFLLSGCGAPKILAQTCSIDFDEAVASRLILTRVAGVSCGVLPEPRDELAIYRLWVDCSYAVYLWGILTQISEELGGRVVGAACHYGELTTI